MHIIDTYAARARIEFRILEQTVAAVGTIEFMRHAETGKRCTSESNTCKVAA